MKTKEHAAIIYKAIIIETQSFESDRATVKLKIDESVLRISIIASDVSATRASLNGVLRWIDMCDNIIKNIHFV